MKQNKIIYLILFIMFLLIINFIINPVVVMWSVCNNKYGIIRIYSFCGYNFNESIDFGKYPTGTIPLFYANTSEMCGLLINAGADVNKYNYMGTPLTHAIFSKNYNVMLTLLEAGAEINMLKNNYFHNDCIYIATVYQNDPEALAILLKYSNTISLQKMVLYLNHINKRDYSLYESKEKELIMKNDMKNSSMLLSTMMPNDQNELLKLMEECNMITETKIKKILSNAFDPVRDNLYY